MRTRKTHLRKIQNVPSKRMDYILIGIIILVAAVLRLWKLGQVPFMHDEFSALLRTRFDNFHDFIQQGVMPDSHPIGVQLFLWGWVKLFGWSAFWVKLPFVLMGIASIYLIYLIGRQWFNRKVGLFSAAFFAVSQFTIFYSQLARPYSAGLFFVLLMAYFWYKIVFEKKQPRLGIYIGFALSAWACSVIQYFSIAQAGLIFLTGLFFLPKERRKAYWLSGLAAVVLFAPTLPIFWQQLFVSGSIGGWLAAPKSTFLTDFIQYTMNYSMLFMFVVGIIIILPLILGRRSKQRQPLRWAGIAWFVIIFAIAFIYSLKREPIIQHSTLIFSYPFVIIVAFSLFGTRTLSPWQTALVVAAILFVGTTSLIMERRYYDLMYHQGFDQIAAEMQQDKDQYGDKIQFATRTEIGEAAEFYQAKTDVENRIIFNRIYNEEGDLVREAELGDFNRWLSEHHEAPMLGFGWTDYVNPIWEATAVGNYPYLIEKKDWFTSRYLTLSKAPVEGGQYLLNDLSENPYAYQEEQEWGKGFTFACDSLPADIEALSVIAKIHNEVELDRCVAVIEVHDAATDSLILWHSSLPDDGHFMPGDHAVADAILFSDNFRPEGKYIKAYLWNQDKKPLVVNKLSYYFTKKSPVLTGLYEPLN
ncbi:MAG: glycosyltransferase family 39 protein [Bacteroidales bacterium]|nr:glycosyltransferase family 39 protein [Bacteroidales bacterium]